MSLNHLQNTASPDIYTDLNSLQNLKTSARKDAQAALPEVARQFESVMISMMIKNMRKTGMEDPLFKSQAMDSYRDMYDQQLSMELSKGQGIGLAKSIVEQMQYQTGQKNRAVANTQNTELKMPERRRFPDHYSLPSNKASEQESHVSAVTQDQDSRSEFATPDQFVEKLWPLAEKTAKKLGVTAEIILSQAALETGWGKYVISQDDKSSFNLFNIKAAQSWQGKRMEKTSMEYIHGKPLQQKSDFRAYSSYEKSFQDYASLIQNSPRYSSYLKDNLEKVSQTEHSLHDVNYINALQKAGYATDPDYSNKVIRVMNSDAIQNQIKVASK